MIKACSVASVACNLVEVQRCNQFIFIDEPVTAHTHRWVCSIIWTGHYAHWPLFAHSLVISAKKFH